MPIGTSRSTPREHSSETKRKAALLRMLQAGVIASDYTTLMMEILKDNAQLEAGEVYGAMDMAHGLSHRPERAVSKKKKRRERGHVSFLAWGP
jgi:hypothetical protein